MANNLAIMRTLLPGITVGDALRQEILGNVRQILAKANELEDTQSRLLIQSSCLDAVTGLEDLIEQYGLDKAETSKL
ncbi:MAG: hypothetical protein KDD62_03670 [Bdellovibrionales bacterium]|nr:hypothetical protein [Bdellovibrionales bacterium]